VLFDKLSNDTTIYFVGDSMSRQHAVDFMCYLSAHFRLTSVDVQRNPFVVDERGPLAGYGLKGATFTSFNKQLHVSFKDGNIGAMGNANTKRKQFTSMLNAVSENDIVVLNAGLHYSRKNAQLASDIENIGSVLRATLKRRVRLIWRETAAAHFDIPSGYWDEALQAKQDRNEAHCVESSEINATLSWATFNDPAVPLLKSIGVPILEVWQASFLMPPWCHIGGGKDCAHFVQPGFTSYMTEALVKYIETL